MDGPRRLRLGVVIGTRPEAIKLAPVILEARERFADTIEPIVVSTAQHRQMLDPILQGFGVAPDHDLDVMLPNQTLTQVTTRVLERMSTLFTQIPFDVVMIQGDTTTCLGTALAAFYARVPVAHVEAGLRTWDMDRPFPEEMNRVVVGQLTAIHFPPTEGSKRNLLREGVADERIVVTGNTAVDAILRTAHDPAIDALFPLADLDPAQRLILVTAHRRESFGEPFQRICQALAEIVKRRDDVTILYPVHLNNNVRSVVMPMLGGLDRVRLVEPLEYRPFVAAMKRAELIISDSGGIQEEATSLDKPVLILRDETERPECVEVGAARLVGTDPERIVPAALELLTDRAAYDAMARVPNPFGDGQASRHVLDGLLAWWRGR